MDVPQPVIPAAWYPDPADQARRRWWDGSAWTDNVADLLAPAPDPEMLAEFAVSPSVVLDQERAGQNVLSKDRAEQNALGREVMAQNVVRAEATTQKMLGAATTTQNVLTRRQLRERVGALVTGDVDVKAPEHRPLPIVNTPELRPEPTFEPVEPSWDSDQFGRSAYVAMAPVRFPEPALAPRKQRSSTLAVWLFAVSPLWIAGGIWSVWRLGVLPTNAVTVFIGIVGVVLAISVALASIDRKRLAARGFNPTAAPAWVLLPLVYFIVRTVRVGRGGLGPLILYVLSQGAVLAIAIAAVIASLPAGASAP